MSETKTLPVDPAKAATFFKRAAEVEKTKNWDYAIAMYVNGLQFDPDNLDIWKKLIVLGRTRKANGGKPGDGLFGEKFTITAKGPLTALLNAGESLARDPDNISKWERLVKASTNSGAVRSAEWFADNFLQMSRADEKASNGTKMSRWRMLKDHYKTLEIFDKARLCAEEATRLAPNDLELITEVKNLAAQNVMRKGNYEEATQEGSSFRSMMKDADKQDQLIAMQRDVKSEDAVARAISEARAKWEKEPGNNGLLRAYVNALIKTEKDDPEKEAIKLLEAQAAKTGDYQLRVMAGDIKMKQYNRNLRIAREQLDKIADPAQKAALQTKLAEKAKQVLAFEIKEYQERTAKYPTDREMRFELGRRFFDAAQYDDAIDNLQQAEQAPKLRTRALNLLGQAFMAKEWYEEAVDTFKRAVSTYEGMETDNVSKELHYNLAAALEAFGSLDEALLEFRKVAQWQLTFRDVRDRVQKLRAQLGKK
jgi:tetratricopeptide (TPR) repeat protein